MAQQQFETDELRGYTTTSGGVVIETKQGSITIEISKFRDELRVKARSSRASFLSADMSPHGVPTLTVRE